MRKNRIKIVLEDMEQSMSYKFLETASDKKEIESIAKKRGLVVPSPDIALFRGIYTKADKFNGNGSRLSSKEISQALDTLILKPLTHNHEEKEIMGIVLDAEFKDNKDVIVWGCIFKDNYGKEYAKFKKDFENGDIGLSYEIYGDKIERADGKYDWKNIFFCGCGILDKDVRPAMHGSKVLEFAMVKEIGIIEPTLTTCNKCNFKFDLSTAKPEDNGGIKCPNCKEIIGLNTPTAETSDIPCDCPVCGMRGWKDVIDTKSNELIAVCTSCSKSFVFEIEEINKNIPKIGMTAVFRGSTKCYQCANIIKYPVWSNLKKTPLTCNKCGLRFIHIEKENTNKFIIKSIMEVNMNELQKAFAKVEKIDDITVEMLSMYEKASEEIQNTLDEKVRELASKKVKEAKKLEDKEKVDKEKVDKEKADKITKKDTAKPADDEKKPTNKIGKEKSYDDIVKETAEILEIDVKKLNDLLSIKEISTEKIEVSTNGITKLLLEVMSMREDAKMFNEYEKELASLKETSNEELTTMIKKKDKELAQVKENYQVQAKTIYSRKQELGEFGKDMTDDNLLNDKDFEIAKLKKELASKKDKDTATITPVIGSNDDKDALNKNKNDGDTKQAVYNKKLKEAAKDLKEKRQKDAKLYS